MVFLKVLKSKRKLNDQYECKTRGFNWLTMGCFQHIVKSEFAFYLLKKILQIKICETLTSSGIKILCIKDLKFIKTKKNKLK